MNGDQLASLVRQGLTFFGTSLLAKWVDAGTVGQVAGALGVLASAGWSMFHHASAKA